DGGAAPRRLGGAGHRRVARDRRGGGGGAGAAGRALRADGAEPGRAGRNGRRDPRCQRGRRGDLAAPRLGEGRREDRHARAVGRAAVRAARHPGPRRRRAGQADPRGAHPAARLAGSGGGEPVRLLAPDPELRSAAARRVGGARGCADGFGRRCPARLLGPLRRGQGGTGAPGPRLGRGDGAHAAPRVAVRPRPGRHPAPRRRHAGRGPGDAPEAGRGRAGGRGAVPAGGGTPQRNRARWRTL
ncbi:MAG: hypothetical protein AVDCRST_MAG04-147, partial [uncultured Acetobacteraceae bacterium]